MGYQAPSYTELLALADELPYSGKNPQRTAFQLLLQKIVQYHQSSANTASEVLKHKELLGAFVCELEIIREKEYGGSLPTKQTGWVYNSGSEFYTTITERLKISEQDNPINEEERLIYLHKFYLYMEKNHPDQKDWVKQIYDRLKRVKERSVPRITALLEAPPKLDVLRANISGILEEYPKVSAARFFQNNKRLLLLKFIDFINETCQVIYPINGNATTEAERAFVNSNMIRSCNVRMGVVLLALMKINGEYSVLSPTRSKLFEGCLSALNLKKLEKLPRDQKIHLLEEVSTHIHNIKNNRAYYDSLIKNWQIKGLSESDLNQFYRELDEFVAIEETDKRKSSFAVTAASVVVQQGVGFAAGYVLPSVGGMLIGGLVGGPVGLAVSFGGTLLWTGLGQLVGNNVVPRALGYLYGWIIDRISMAATTTAVGAFGIAYSFAQGGLQSLLSHPNLKKEDREFIEEWIDTLLALPDGIMSKKEKDQIRFVLHIKPENANDSKIELLADEADAGLAARPSMV